MANGEFDELKSILRNKVKARRARLVGGDRTEAAAKAAEHFLNSVPFAETDVIGLFWPIRDEIDSKPLMLKLMEKGQTVCLPVTAGDGEPLVFRIWEPDAPLFEAGFGTLAPGALAPEAAPDVLVIPLLGFDGVGTRLGYGRGYYDKTIAAFATRPLVVGYAFAVQELNDIPREDHDIPLDMLVTETGVRRFDN